MTGATSPRLHLELLCARLLLPASDATERGINARVDRLERRVAYAGEVPAGTVLPAYDGGGSPAAGSAGGFDVPARAGCRPGPRGVACGARGRTGRGPGCPAGRFPAAGWGIAAGRADPRDGVSCFGGSVFRAGSAPAAPVAPAADAPCRRAEQASAPSAESPDQDEEAYAPVDEEPVWGDAAGWDEPAEPAAGKRPRRLPPLRPRLRPHPQAPPRPRSLPRLGRIVGRHARTGEAQGPRGCRGASTRRSTGTGRPGAGRRPRAMLRRRPLPNLDQVQPSQRVPAPAANRAGIPGGAGCRSPDPPAGRRQQPAQQQTAASTGAAAAGAAVRTPRGPAGQTGQPGQPAAASAQAAAGGSVEMFRRAWPEIMNELQSVKKFLWMTVQPNASVTGYDGRSLTVSFAHQGAMTAFTRSQDNVNLLAQCIHKVLGVQCQIVVTAGGSAPAGGSGPKAERRPRPADTPSVAPRPTEPAAAVAPAATAPAEPTPAGAAPSAAGSPMAGPSAAAPSAAGPVDARLIDARFIGSGSPAAAPPRAAGGAQTAAPQRAAPAARRRPLRPRRRRLPRRHSRGRTRPAAPAARRRRRTPGRHPGPPEPAGCARSGSQAPAAPAPGGLTGLLHRRQPAHGALLAPAPGERAPHSAPAPARRTSCRACTRRRARTRCTGSDGTGTRPCCPRGSGPWPLQAPRRARRAEDDDPGYGPEPDFGPEPFDDGAYDWNADSVPVPDWELPPAGAAGIPRAAGVPTRSGPSARAPATGGGRTAAARMAAPQTTAHAGPTAGAAKRRGRRRPLPPHRAGKLQRHPPPVPPSRLPRGENPPRRPPPRRLPSPRPRARDSGSAATSS